MSQKSAAVLRVGLVAAAAIGYDLLSYYSVTHPGRAALGTTLALLPPLLFVIGLAWRSRWRGAVIVAGAALTALLWRCWPLLSPHFTLMFLLQQVFMWGALLLFFANSLLKGRIPLCTQWADLVHGPLSDAERRYTRGVTLAWSLFFGAMALTGVLLYVFAPAPVWSAFNNLWSLPLVAAMFVTEYAVRLLALPRQTHVGLFEAVRLFSQSRR